MTATRFRLADRSDDAALRRFIAETEMDGSLRVSFPREPSYFDALEVLGQHTEAGVCEEEATGRCVALGTRSVKLAYVNGAALPVGYLSSLRVAPDCRNGALLARMYRQAKRQHEDGRTKIYVTTIIDDNVNAKELLTSQRCGLPKYEDLGRLFTLAVGLKQRNPFVPNPVYQTRRATEADVEDVLRLLHEEGARKQFFPVYTRDDLLSPVGLLRGLGVGDLRLAFANGELVGVLGIWDQRSFRQSKIVGYGGVLRLGRRLYNATAGLLGYPVLPDPGTTLAFPCLALVCVKGNASDVFASLLASVFDLLRPMGFPFFTLGLHERDGLLNATRKAKCFRYTSRVYVAHWEDGRELFESLDDRIPYLEVGAL